jgi:acyl-phosphate glycerol 3-phosphate acyltransferase
MYWLFLLSGMIVAYLVGSANFAIIVSTIVGETDIRTVGNLNPGTANIGRNLGKGWGTIVFLGDVSKVVVPLIIAEDLYFNFGTFTGTAGLMLMGMAAILGHRKPIFFKFSGGGGLATTIGVLAFFGPVELFIAMILGAGLGTMLFRNKEFKVGRWMAMFIILLAPVVHLVLAFIFETRIGGVLGLGGFDPARIGAVGVLAMYIFVSNIGTVIVSVRAGTRSDPVDQSKNP